jgi:hypothetical protein
MYLDIDTQILGALVKWITETHSDESIGDWMNIDEFGLKEEHLDLAINEGIIKINRKGQLRFLITDVITIMNILLYGDAYQEGQR